MKPKLFNGTEWIEFNTQEEYEAYIRSISNPVQATTVEQDIEFGKSLILKYLEENKRLDLATIDSIGQLQKFSSIKMLLEVGAIGAARDILSTVEPDQWFTQERKTNYLELLNVYLNGKQS